MGNDSGKTSPRYVHWRTEILAELVFTKLNLIYTKLQPDSAADYTVCTRSGDQFLVEVKGLSSIARRIRNIETIEELRWRVPSQLLETARRSDYPFFLFLFDADTEHGRYLRIDTLPEDASSARDVTLRFPKANTLDRHGLQKLLLELEVNGHTASKRMGRTG